MWDPASVAISAPEPSPGAAQDGSAERGVRHESHPTGPPEHSEPANLRERWVELKSDRMLTLPNLISIARLAGVPLFLWFMLGPHEDGNAVLVLIAGGISDWLD